jgi:hypothetical protein
MRAWSSLRHVLPKPLWKIARAIGTATLTPLLFSLQSGHLKSSFRSIAVGPDGQALPWYTYPCVEFLLTRNFRGRRVLEAGAGQSTLWWASRGAQVVALEGDQNWLDSLQRQVPGNVSLRLVSLADVEACLQSVTEAIKDEPTFDVIIIDGLYRSEVLSILADRLAPNGIIICDDSEGYGFFNVLSREELQRVDFYGYAPGVIEKHCTSIAFRESAFVFAPNIPVHEPPLGKPDPTRRGDVYGQSRT